MLFHSPFIPNLINRPVVQLMEMRNASTIQIPFSVLRKVLPSGQSTMRRQKSNCYPKSLQEFVSVTRKSRYSSRKHCRKTKGGDCDYSTWRVSVPLALLQTSGDYSYILLTAYGVLQNLAVAWYEQQSSLKMLQRERKSKVVAKTSSQARI